MFDIDTGILENPNGVDGSTWETVELDSSLGALELGLGLDYPGDGYIIHYYP